MNPVAKTTLDHAQWTIIGVNGAMGHLPAAEELASVNDNRTDVQAFHTSRDHRDRRAQQRDNQDDEERDNVKRQVIGIVLRARIAFIFHYRGRGLDGSVCDGRHLKMKKQLDSGRMCVW